MFSVTDYKNKVNVSVVLNKKFYKVGYSFIHKGPKYVWYRMSKNTIDKKNMKRRLTFKEDYSITKQFRCKHSDYTGYGYDIGHLYNDAIADYSKESLKASYLLSNAVPQLPNLNRKGWYASERYARYITKKLGYVYIVNIVDYGTDVIGNRVGVPESIYKIILNKKNEFIKIFKFNRYDNSYSIKDNVITMNKLNKALKKL